MKDKIELKQLREGWWVFSKDEFLEMVKAVDRGMKSRHKDQKKGGEPA